MVVERLEEGRADLGATVAVEQDMDPDAAPDDWASLSDDERAAWMAGRRAGRTAGTDPGDPAG